MEEPKVTILLATYNRAHLIGETLYSIQNQTYKNWECIIVDDHSIDNTKEVVCDFTKKDNRFLYFLKTDNYKKGLPDTRNYGLDIAEQIEAEFIQFFDDDDIMHPNKLLKQMELFKKDKELDIANCKYQGFKGDFNLDNHIYVGDMNIVSHNIAEDFLRKKISINSLGPIFRAQILKGLRFDTELNYYAEEEEFYIRLFFLKKPSYGVVNDFLFFYRHHEASITSDNKKNIHKLGSVIRMYQKLWVFLSENQVLTKQAALFFFKYFLINHYDSNYLKNILLYIKNAPNISSVFKIEVVFIYKIHHFYRRIVTKILN